MTVSETRILLSYGVVSIGVWLHFPVAGQPAKEAPLPNFETTAKLRDQVGCEVDWGSPATQVGERVFTNDAAAIARMFREDQGAVMCQGASYYLHLKYLEAGYRSYLVGFQGKAISHSMVLVEIRRDDGSSALVVQDPSFNLSYFDRAGKVLSIFEIVSRLATAKPGDIVIKEGAPAETTYLRHPSDPDPLGLEPGSAPLHFVKELVGPSKANPSLQVYKATVSFGELAGHLRKIVADGAADEDAEIRILRDIFGRPIYVYRRYPMTREDQRDADKVLSKLKELHAQSQSDN